MRAWRLQNGDVVISKDRQDGQFLRLPCGNCIGCRTNYAQSWALRCQLELQHHETAIFATLTYDDANKPLTLQKNDVSTFLRKSRRRLARRLRFFASGEYGEYTNRPHYHAIIYGASQFDEPRLQEAWGKGHIQTDTATLANIAYTAGYCSKKIGYKRQPHDRVDAATGQRYQWQPPFILMSRNPGIGAEAKEFLNSWRLYAIKDGHKTPVPRYYKEHWKLHATLHELEQLREDIDNLNLTAPTLQQLAAGEKIAEAKQRQQSEKRYL